MRLKKLRVIYAAALAEADEELRTDNLHAKKVKTTSTSNGNGAIKVTKAREKSERGAMQAEDALASALEKMAQLQEDYVWAEVVAALLAGVHQMEGSEADAKAKAAAAEEKKKRAAKAKASHEKRQDKRRLEDEKIIAKATEKVEDEAKKEAVKAAVAAKSAADRKAMLYPVSGSVLAQSQ